jgi:SAM-dependent methyltransferase
MTLFNEEILEPLARVVRFREGIQYIDSNKSIRIADLGCGPHAPFYDFLQKNNINIKEYVGVDPLIQIKPTDKEGGDDEKILKMSVGKKISLKPNTFDYVVGFAFIEHIDYPKKIINEAIRILKPGGKLILTTPTPRAKKLLEFLAYKLKLLSRREIEEHKHYFTKVEISKLINKNKYNVNMEHKLFEFGLNNLFVIKKLK